MFYVRGSLRGRMPLVVRGQDRFKATWQSESSYTRHGEKDSSTEMCEKNLHAFNMLFVSAETDLDYYNIPTYHLPSWADMETTYEMGSPELDGLGFIGGAEGREDFLSQDKKGIIRHMRARIAKGGAFNTSKEYARTISRFRMLVAPPGRCFNGMTGRTFEIMSCRRLCFAYFNPDSMFIH